VSAGDPIRFVDLQAQRARLGDAVDRAIARVLEHGAFIHGPEVAELEGRLASYAGVEHVVSCSSGTDALLLPLLAWGVRPGDAVVVPAFTFAATAEVVSLLGATPVFADCDPETFVMEPTSAEAALDTAVAADLVPRAIVPVDLFGQPADYDSLGDLAKSRGVALLADAAQSFGATWQGRRTGGFGDAAATSFFPAKPLGCYGDGGAVFTDDAALAGILRSLRSHGQGDHKYDTVRVGVNGRLDTIQAAVLLEKLAIFDDELAARRSVAERYTDGLDDHVSVPVVHPSADSAWAQYTVLVNGRDDVAARLRDAGVPTAVYYPVPLHHQPAYAMCPVSGKGLGVSESLARRVLSLPMHPYLDEHVQDRIIEAVADACVAGGNERSA
jgi:dTDP-4-amino-4,6-dideoxygalactose transaminase